MAIQVITLPAPTSGVDWTWTVPGQWLPYLYGVQAELVTSSPVTAFPDETGNGHSLNISSNQSHWTLGAPGPYGGGANNFACAGDGTFVTPNLLARGANTTAFSQAKISADWWALVKDDGTAHVRNIGAVGNTSFSDTVCNLFCTAAAGHNSALEVQLGGTLHTFGDTGAPLGAWHHRAFTCDGTTGVVYTDGVQTGSALMSTVDVGASQAPAGPGSAGQGLLFGSVAGLAFYGTALSSAQVAIHAAAGGSWTNYRTAVLSDAPVALWGFNTIPSLQNRQVTLVVTDGTNIVGQYPAQFPNAVAAGFIWSWQAQLSSAQTSPDGTTNSVPIPEIRVNSGYTIGVKTLDLQPTDDWQNITLWFDDGTGPGGSGGPGGPGPGGYLDATLYPDTYTGG